MAVGLTVLNECHSYMIWMSVNHIWMGVIHVWMPVWMSVTNQWVSRTLIRMSVTNTSSDARLSDTTQWVTPIQMPMSHTQWVTLIQMPTNYTNSDVNELHSFRCQWITLPLKNGVIALWPNTRVVKCKYYVSQKQNRFINKIPWYSILLTLIFKFTARL